MRCPVSCLVLVGCGATYTESAPSDAGAAGEDRVVFVSSTTTAAASRPYRRVDGIVVQNDFAAILAGSVAPRTDQRRRRLGRRNEPGLDRQLDGWRRDR